MQHGNITTFPPNATGTSVDSEVLEHLTYNEDLNQVECDVAIQTTLNTLKLGDQHEMSSGAENIFFTNNSSGVNYSPVWEGIKDQKLEENRGKDGLIKPIGRRYSDDLLGVELTGPEQDPLEWVVSGRVQTVAANTSVFGIKFRTKELLPATSHLRYDIFIGEDTTGIKVYSQTIDITTDIQPETLIEWWFDHPTEGFAGTVIYTVVTEVTNTGQDKPFYTSKSSTGDFQWGESFFRTFEDEEMTFNIDGGVYITNVTGVGNTVKVYKDAPNNVEVSNVTLESNLNVRVDIEWDRPIEEYEGSPTVNGNPVIKLGKQGSAYTGYVVIADLGEDNIEAKLGSITNVVTTGSLTKPTGTAEITSDYPSGQTELSAGQTLDITIDPDSSVSRIEVQAGQVSSGTTVNTSSTTITIPSTYVGTSPLESDVTVRFMNSEGTWSDWITTSNKVVVNDLHPSIVFGNTTYPNGQKALKDSETALVNVNVTNSDSNDYTTSSELVLVNDTEVERVSGDYTTATYTVSSTRAANGTETVLGTSIRIANTDVSFTTNTPVQVRSGVGAVTLPCTYTQELLNTVSNPTVTATDSDVHSLATLTKDISVTNLAGKTVSLARNYLIKGFARKTLNMTFPASNLPIGTDIVSVPNVIISGQINDSPPYQIATNYKTTLGEVELVSDYTFVNNDSVGFNLTALIGFNYDPSTNITINIEEL